MSQYLDKDGASRIAENFLSKQAEQDAILRNLQFDLKEAEHALVKTVQGPAPLNIRALTRPLDDYLISGNTLQDGTPTPSNPVDVYGVGVRTENLLDISTVLPGYITSTNGAIRESSDYGEGYVRYIPVKPNTEYSFKIYQSADSYSVQWIGIAEYSEATESSWVQNAIRSVTEDPSCTFTTSATTKFLCVSARNLLRATQAILNEGSTALPYEPYGYKLPLTVNGTEYPIYLGQVQTTRRIKKLVVDGTESTWQEFNNLNLLRLPGTPRDYRSQVDGALCDSLPLVARGDLTANSFCWSTGTIGELIININNYNLADLKTYLSSNPITIWYVLATPETAIVNEPLHKIGDYADTISFEQAGVEISTTKGFNTITTDTTVLPSNIEVKGVINNA